jgi:NitT/TauT family transport system substrate-binding protein
MGYQNVEHNTPQPMEVCRPEKAAMRSFSNDVSTRREFLRRISFVGTATILGVAAQATSGEPPLETTTLKIIYDPDIPGICYAPQLVAEDLLRADGFKDVRYVKLIEGSESKTLATGQADISADFAANLLMGLERGYPITALSGLHIGCIELVGTGRVKSVRDLRGKTIAITGFGQTDHMLTSIILAYVGLDPRKDVKWAIHPPSDWAKLLAEEKVDALLVFPPESQELRAQKIGRVIVNSTTDKPWSQYFCCMLAANRSFVQKHPVATKRAMRAIFKANEICATQPERAAKLLTERGFASRYEHAIQTLREIPYAKLLEYEPESTLRFYALRLRDVGMIKTNPNTLIAKAGDWRFLRELKKELKA